MRAKLKISRRSRSFLIVAAALFCAYIINTFIAGFPERYLNVQHQAEVVQTPPADQHERHAGDGKTFLSGEVETNRDDYAGARIGKISMLYGEPNPTYERALRSHENHAKLHRYPLFILRQKLLGRLWSKPAYILSILLQELEKPDPTDRLEWLFWFDADTYLLNQKIPLETFLPPTPEMAHIHFMCGNDHNGLNDGSFFVRVNDWTLHLMAASISLEELRPEVSLKYSEQSAIEHLVKHETLYVDHTAIVPQRWYNAFMGPREWDGRIKPNRQIIGNSVQEGDLLVHFAGSGDTKKGRMTKFMNAFEKNRQQWELEVTETEILAEIKEFWEVWAVFEKERVQKGLPMPDKSAKSLGAGSKDDDRDAADVKPDYRTSQQAHELEVEDRKR